VLFVLGGDFVIIGVVELVFIDFFYDFVEVFVFIVGVGVVIFGV